MTGKPVVFEHKEVTVKPVAKAKPQLKVSCDTVSCLYSYLDIDTQPLDHDCFAVSKAMIRLLRHGASGPREDDGAVRVDDHMKKLRQSWPVNDWITYLAKGGGQKKRFQYCLNPHSSKPFQSNLGIFRKQSRRSYIARQCTVAGGRHRVHPPRRTCK